MFTLSFDTASLAAIAQMYGWKVFLTDSVGIAMKQAGDLLTQAAQANTWEVFANPNGDLADSIVPVLDSPWEVQVGVGVPYGRRREYGFSGMTDSLGRTYANDPAKPYMQPALDDNRDAVLQLIDEAVLSAWEQVGGGQ